MFIVDLLNVPKNGSLFLNEEACKMLSKEFDSWGTTTLKCLKQTLFYQN